MREEKVKYCPECWRRLPPDVAYCPLCGVKAEIEPFLRPTLLTIAALAATAAACVSMIGGLLTILIAYILSGFYLSSGQFDLGMLLLFVILGLFNFAGFVLGAIAGSCSWKKRSFRLTVVAIALLPLVGLLNLIVMYVHRGFGLFWALAIGVPMTILSLLSLTFVVIKQKEFK